MHVFVRVWSFGGRFSVLVKKSDFTTSLFFLYVPYKVSILLTLKQHFKSWSIAMLNIYMFIASLSPFELLDSSISWWSIVSYTMKPVYNLSILQQILFYKFFCLKERVLPPTTRWCKDLPHLQLLLMPVHISLNFHTYMMSHSLQSFNRLPYVLCVWLLMVLRGLVASGYTSVPCSSQLSFLKRVPTDVWKQWSAPPCFDFFLM